MCICVYVYMCVCVYVCMCICVYVYMYVCVYVYMCVCVYVYMCVCVYVYMCICVYVYMLYIYVSISYTRFFLLLHWPIHARYASYCQITTLFCSVVYMLSLNL